MQAKINVLQKYLHNNPHENQKLLWFCSGTAVKMFMVV